MGNPLESGNEEDYLQLIRMVGRYKRMRADALKEISGAGNQPGAPDKFIAWIDIRGRVLSKRGENGYDAAEETKRHYEKRIHIGA